MASDADIGAIGAGGRYAGVIDHHLGTALLLTALAEIAFAAGIELGSDHLHALGEAVFTAVFDITGKLVAGCKALAAVIQKEKV